MLAFFRLDAAPRVLPFPEEADWGSSTYSFAGASAAISHRQDAVSTNPAGLAFFQGSSSFGGEYLSLPNNEQKWSLTIVDGSNGIVGGTRFSWDSIDSADRQKFSAAFAYKLPYISIGGTGHVIKFIDVAEGNGWHFTQSLGFLAPVMGGFTIGGYLNYFLDAEKDSYLPPSIHLGALYTYPQFLRATFDADKRFYLDGEDWNYSVAGDIMLNEFFSVRGGYRWAHAVDRSFWNLGAALLAPKIELTGFFMRTVGDKQKNGFGFDVYFKF